MRDGHCRPLATCSDCHFGIIFRWVFRERILDGNTEFKTQIAFSV